MESKVSVDDKAEKWIKHYSSSHKILLVGEGDFSFSACLAEAFGSASNMVATSLDSKAFVANGVYTVVGKDDGIFLNAGKCNPAFVSTLGEKHPTAVINLKKLEDYGCNIVHGVDACTMSQHPLLNLKTFDRIVFNFPHAGFLYSEHSKLQIQLHQDVVREYLRNARDMIAKGGEVHVTHKTAHPFSTWEIEKIAEEAGLHLVEEANFTTSDYPGYENKRGDGYRSNDTFPVGQCSTFKFSKL